jgi:hypothetical protein
MLSIKMSKQPSFMVMATYVAWMCGQTVPIVLVSLSGLSEEVVMLTAAFQASGFPMLKQL